MTVYTYADARERLSTVLDEAERNGAVRIRRPDGREFELLPVDRAASPFDIDGPTLDLTADDIVEAVREGRSRDSG